MRNIITSPLITEKNTILSEDGVYVFQVTLDSSKPEIKNAIEKGFSVKVKSIKTAVCRDDMKYTRFGLSKARKWKKAYVRLAEGQKLSLFEGA